MAQSPVAETHKGTLTEQQWVNRLIGARNQLEDARHRADQAYDRYCDDIRAAFDDGLSVVPIREATGLTASRIYQIKGGRRT